jgi:hypothetical protein
MRLPHALPHILVLFSFCFFEKSLCLDFDDKFDVA